MWLLLNWIVQQLRKKIKELTDDIPEGKEVKLNRYNYVPAKNTFTDQKKDLATNYIQGITSGPQPGSSDFNAFAIAMRIFYDRQFLEVRTNNGLSYAPQTRFNGGLYSLYHHPGYNNKSG